MKSPLLWLWVSAVLVTLAACDVPATPACVWPTEAGPVALPTSGLLSCGATACPTPLPTCAPLPIGRAAPTSTLPLTCDLSFQNRTIKQLTWTDDDEQLVDVALGPGGENVVLFRRNGHLLLDMVDRESWNADLGPVQAAQVAMGKGELALVWESVNGQWQVNFAPDVYALADAAASGSANAAASGSTKAAASGSANAAPTLTAGAVALPSGVGLAPGVAAYGPEGWLHLFTSGGEWRYNPTAKQWEPFGAWPGLPETPVQVALTANGTLFLLAPKNLYRRPAGAERWEMSLAEADLLAAAPGARSVQLSGLAVLGDRVGLAWVARFDNGVGEWVARESADTGVTWQPRGYYAVRCEQNSCDAVFPGFREDGALTVTGIFHGIYGNRGQAQVEGKSDIIEAYWSQRQDNWCPDPTGQAAFASILNTYVTQPLGQVKVVSRNGQNVVVFELRQFTGRNDLYGLRY